MAPCNADKCCRWRSGEKQGKIRGGRGGGGHFNRLQCSLHPLHIWVCLQRMALQLCMVDRFRFLQLEGARRTSKDANLKIERTYFHRIRVVFVFTCALLATTCLLDEPRPKILSRVGASRLQNFRIIIKISPKVSGAVSRVPGCGMAFLLTHFRAFLRASSSSVDFIVPFH